MAKCGRQVIEAVQPVHRHGSHGAKWKYTSFEGGHLGLIEFRSDARLTVIITGVLRVSITPARPRHFCSNL